MVAVAMPAGDPVSSGDDVDSGVEHRDVEVLVGEDSVERQHIRLRGDDFVDGAGGLDADGCQASQLTDVPADLLRRIAPKPANSDPVNAGGSE